MTAKNDITGHLLMTKAPSQAYKDNYDRIFRKGNPDKEKENGSTTQPSAHGNGAAEDTSKRID